MSQILNIFRKDTRRFWPEIAISLAVLAGLVCASRYISRWVLDHPDQGRMIVVFASLSLLAVASWLLLIVRVIQAESLVGDTQFWITRPYEWKKLLAAKVLFLGVYLYLPLAVAQFTMLKGAGFHPQWHVGGLLYNLLLITTYVVIPCVALACVTANLARMALTLAGIVACLAGIVASLISRIAGTTSGANLPDATLIPRVVLLSLCIAAIGLQYATRRTWLARLVLLAVPVCVFAIVPFRTIERVYARQSSAGDAVPDLRYSPTPGRVMAPVAPTDQQIRFDVPVESVGLPGKTILAIDDVKVVMEAPDGTRWVSPWEGTFPIPVGKRGMVNLVLPRSIYASFLGKPLSLHLTLAVSEAREESSTAIPLPSVDFAVPGDGICSASSSTSERVREVEEHITARCKFPLRLPYRKMSALMPNPGCDSAGEEWSGSLANEPAELAIDPVWFDSGLNTGHTSSFDGDRPASVCTATGVAITQYRLERHIQVSMTIPDYQLPSLPPSRR
jgi:hypothetical protein